MSKVLDQYNQDVQNAIDEAEGFIKRAKTYLNEPHDIRANKNRSAMKRSSMDLTRSLVSLRKGHY
jgi:hypothetical protein